MALEQLGTSLRHALATAGSISDCENNETSVICKHVTECCTQGGVWVGWIVLWAVATVSVVSMVSWLVTSRHKWDAVNQRT